MILNLNNARYLSKFHLKVGFWQLRVHPDDRLKMAFIVPDIYYQWTVMLFHLKVAPSLFQKAMKKIFQPILHSVLIYIDDILLYSPDEESHLALLKQYHEIVQSYSIMLSESKMHIFQEEIKFLGMILKNSRYKPSPHITAELEKFLDKDLSKKEIQQFLGIVNYLRNFIPKLSCITKALQQMLKKESPILS